MQPSLFDWAECGGAEVKKRKSQTECIRDWLIAGGTLTAREAVEMWGCFRLAARIHELRNMGMSIIEENIPNDCGRGVHAKYFIGGLA